MIGQKTGGRKKGTENKNSALIKEAFRILVEENLDNMTDWLERIAKDNPDKALQLLLDVSERVLPKLQRSDVSVTATVEGKQVFEIGGKKIEF